VSKQEFKEIIYEKPWRDYVARLLINRPQSLNAYTLTTLREINQALEDAMWDDSIQLIVFTGVGDRGFCTGGDVDEYATIYTRRPSDFYKWWDSYDRMLWLLRSCGKLVISRVNGAVAGGGNEIHCACDLSIAAEHARFLQPGPRVGMTSIGGASQWLPIMIGLRRAAWMLLTTEVVDAKTALEWGLVNEVVPYEKLDDAVEKLCKVLLDKMPISLRYAKTHLNVWKDAIWSLTAQHARDWFTFKTGGIECYEGLWAFREKRKARYDWIRGLIKEGKYDFLWGPPTKKCPKCGAENLPEDFGYCGRCGSRLE